MDNTHSLARTSNIVDDTAVIPFLTTSESLGPSRAVVHKALRERAFATGVARSTNPDEWYFDYRAVTLQSDVLAAASDLLWQMARKFTPCQVGGIESGAIGLVAGTIMQARAEGMSINGFFVRKSRKKDGTQRIIEGTLTNDDIVLIDDGINSGRSVIKQIETLAKDGKRVRAVCVLLRFRDLSEYTYFSERGIELCSAFTLDDFPETGGMISSSQNASTQAPEQVSFVPIWRFNAPDPEPRLVLPKSAPCIDDNRVYLGCDDGALRALSKNNGEVAWSFKTLFGAGGKRILSSPILWKKTLIFGAYDGNVYALNTETGAKRWVFLRADWVGSSPAIAADLKSVFIGVEFGLWNKQGGLVALDVETGEKKWSAQIDALVHSSPSYSRKRSLVVVGSNDGTVYAFHARTGKLVWMFKANGPVRGGFAWNESENVVCFGSEDTNLYVLNAKDGSLAFTIETYEGIYTTPLVHDEKLYIGLLDKRIMCVSLKTRAVAWTHWTNGRIFATPIIADGLLMIGSNDGCLYALDPTTGAIRGYLQLTERIVNAAAYDATSKQLFIPTQMNELYCCSLTRKATN